jgi:hypothetical protein
MKRIGYLAPGFKTGRARLTTGSRAYKSNNEPGVRE